MSNLIEQEESLVVEGESSYNRSISLFAPSDGFPSNSLTGQVSLFFSHKSFNSSKALAWESERLFTATGESSGKETDEGGVS